LNKDAKINDPVDLQKSVIVFISNINNLYSLGQTMCHSSPVAIGRLLVASLRFSRDSEASARQREYLRMLSKAQTQPGTNAARNSNLGSDCGCVHLKAGESV
jgi:hypothetical protein